MLWLSLPAKCLWQRLRPCRGVSHIQDTSTAYRLKLEFRYEIRSHCRALS